MILYFIRHGWPNYEIDGLTATGRYQADATSEALKNIPFETIYASELGRAYETATYLAKKQNKEIIKLHWAREDLAGQQFATFDETVNLYTWIFWIEKYRTRMMELSDDMEFYKDKVFSDVPVEAGVHRINDAVDEWFKSMNIIHDRKTKTYHQVGDKHVPEYIALFAHGGMAMATLSSILDLPYSYFSTHFNCLDTCGVVVIDIDLDVHVARLWKYNQIFYDPNINPDKDEVKF